MKKFCFICLVWFSFQIHQAQARVVCMGSPFEETCRGKNVQGESVSLDISGMPSNRYISGFIGNKAVGLQSYQVLNTIQLQGYFGQSEVNVQAYEVENTEFATGHIGAQNFNIRIYKNGNLYHIIGFIGQRQINEYTSFLESTVDQIFQIPFIPIAPYYFQSSLN